MKKILDDLPFFITGKFKAMFKVTEKTGVRVWHTSLEEVWWIDFLVAP